ncbi:hypothetical protein MACJ_001611 [Theileria orientalis]|uniref:Uncharacterized protein n=1 Tax=Theileria orientalis TaxID=68886 RepID=A0A976M8W8_THEOR|nr:hypothetical protein MACJ_001611 [Theileria orientalis]
MEELLPLVGMTLLGLFLFANIEFEDRHINSKNTEPTQIALKMAALSNKIELIRLNSVNLRHFLMIARGSTPKKTLPVELHNDNEELDDSTSGEIIELSVQLRTDLNHQTISDIEDRILNQHLDLLGCKRIKNQLIRQLHISNMDWHLYRLQEHKAKIIESIGVQILFWAMIIQMLMYVKALNVEVIVPVTIDLLASYLYRLHKVLDVALTLSKVYSKVN